VPLRRRRPGANRDAGAPQSVRRRADGPPGLRKLPPDLEDLASGRRDALRPRRRPKGRIADSRVAGLIAGVANHEARRVFDARVERLRRPGVSEPELERGLCEVALLGLWRGRNVMGFDVLAQDVLGIPIERARALAKRGAEQRGVDLSQLPDIAVALWMRSEAALLDRHPAASIEARVKDERIELVISLPLAPPLAAAEAVASVGRSAVGLARVLAGEPPLGPPRDPK
jgi:hypothetical protein